jgi:hypothetical protein
MRTTGVVLMMFTVLGDVDRHRVLDSAWSRCALGRAWLVRPQNPKRCREYNAREDDLTGNSIRRQELGLDLISIGSNEYPPLVTFCHGWGRKQLELVGAIGEQCGGKALRDNTFR